MLTAERDSGRRTIARSHRRRLRFLLAAMFTALAFGPSWLGGQTQAQAGAPNVIFEPGWAIGPEFGTTHAPEGAGRNYLGARVALLGESWSADGGLGAVGVNGDPPLGMAIHTAVQVQVDPSTDFRDAGLTFRTWLSAAEHVEPDGASEWHVQLPLAPVLTLMPPAIPGTDLRSRLWAMPYVDLLEPFSDDRDRGGPGVTIGLALVVDADGAADPATDEDDSVVIQFSYDWNPQTQTAGSYHAISLGVRWYSDRR